jgi:hypothetical protein
MLAPCCSCPTARSSRAYHRRHRSWTSVAHAGVGVGGSPSWSTLSGSTAFIPQHREWQPGQAQIAAAGGADRRSANNAARPMHQSREAHLAAWPHHSPEGGHNPYRGSVPLLLQVVADCQRLNAVLSGGLAGHTAPYVAQLWGALLRCAHRQASDPEVHLLRDEERCRASTATATLCLQSAWLPPSRHVHDQLSPLPVERSSTCWNTRSSTLAVTRPGPKLTSWTQPLTAKSTPCRYAIGPANRRRASSSTSSATDAIALPYPVVLS